MDISEVASYMKEILSIGNEVKDLQKEGKKIREKVKELKQQQQSLKEKIQIYMLENELEVLEYGNYEIEMAQKSKRKRKKKDEKIASGIEVLNKHNMTVSNPKEFIEELTEAMRGEKEDVNILQIKMPVINIASI